MSFKAKIAAGAATFALAGGGLGLAGTLSASAATPSCGGNCVNPYTQKFGPHYFMDVYQARAAAGQEVILFQRSNSDPAEDFTYRNVGTVDSFYGNGLVSAGFDHTYSMLQAYEIEYSPYGVNSGFCVGTWPGVPAQAGYKIRLEQCGQTSSTVWAVDYPPYPNPSKYVSLINGSETNFSDPLVLNYPAGHPTDMPRPWLNVQPLHTYSDGTVFDNQLWSAKFGVLK